jgi:pimeloyl-ACP methyl ester carboxylesterase
VPVPQPARDIHYYPSGDGATAVMLVHGQPGSAADWDRVVPLLRDDHLVLAPDRPGYGRTGGGAGGFRYNAAAMTRVLDSAGIERAVVAGHSWGGGVAVAMAAGHPDRVAGLVLVSSVDPGSPARVDDRILAARGVGETAALFTLGLTGLLLSVPWVRELSTRALPQGSADGLRTLTSLAVSNRHAAVWRSFVVEQRALIEELQDFEPGLGRINVPAVVLHGDADHLVPLSEARRLAGAIPGATLRVLAGAGHFLPLDRSNAVADAVRAVVVAQSGAGGDQTDR